MNDLKILEVEVNITDNCNRSCDFCPQSTLSEFDHYATITHEMSRDTIDDVARGLIEYNEANEVIASFAGFGEPLLAKNIRYAIEKIAPYVKTRIITNGDILLEHHFEFFNEMKLYELKIDLYDNDEQMDRLNDMLAISPFNGNLIIKKVYEQVIEELPFYNRGGHCNVETNFPEKSTYCIIPMEHVIIDYTGDYLLCSADWLRDSTISKAHKNIKDVSILEYLVSDEYTNIVDHMKAKNRDALHPCKDCNVWGQGKLEWD